MQTVTVTVINEVGLHARPASLMVNLLKEYTSKIEVYKNGNAEKKQIIKSIFSVMALGAIYGDELTFEADGADEKEAIEAIEGFVKSGCGD
jgi:phosphocarrier protein